MVAIKIYLTGGSGLVGNNMLKLAAEQDIESLLPFIIKNLNPALN
ncbi:MAG: hypothetical protein R2865_11695 [Deinococcales bacterium]